LSKPGSSILLGCNWQTKLQPKCSLMFFIFLYHSVFLCFPYTSSKRSRLNHMKFPSPKPPAGGQPRPWAIEVGHVAKEGHWSHTLRLQRVMRGS
jgi:hypothetical protein